MRRNPFLITFRSSISSLMSATALFSCASASSMRPKRCISASASKGDRVHGLMDNVSSPAFAAAGVVRVRARSKMISKLRTMQSEQMALSCGPAINVGTSVDGLPQKPQLSMQYPSISRAPYSVCPVTRFQTDGYGGKRAGNRRRNWRLGKMGERGEWVMHWMALEIPVRETCDDASPTKTSRAVLLHTPASIRPRSS